jgi:hypothetical protein
MIYALTSSKSRKDLSLLVLQLRRNDPGDRLANHLVRVITEYAGCTGIPGGDLAFQALADDGVIRGVDDGSEPFQLNICLMALRNVHKKIDCADQPTGSVPQRRRIGKKANPCTVRPFGNGLNAANCPSLLQGGRHRAFIVLQNAAVRPI